MYGIEAPLALGVESQFEIQFAINSEINVRGSVRGYGVETGVYYQRALGLTHNKSYIKYKSKGEKSHTIKVTRVGLFLNFGCF
jgi:hypothetical protein